MRIPRVLKIRFGSKMFLFGLSHPRFRPPGWTPIVELGPFGCWNWRWTRFRIGWELVRWH
jgi:hypothetical protein